MFDFLTEILTKNGKGIHAHRACADAGYAAARQHPEAAAAFVLLARGSEAFVEMNERMPITAADIETAFATFNSDVERLAKAWNGGSDTARLAALNVVAARLGETYGG